MISATWVPLAPKLDLQTYSDNVAIYSSIVTYHLQLAPESQKELAQSTGRKGYTQEPRSPLVVLGIIHPARFRVKQSLESASIFSQVLDA
jgi:hypothetical protein